MSRANWGVSAMMTWRVFLNAAVVCGMLMPSIAKSEDVKISGPIVGIGLLTEDGRGFWGELLGDILRDGPQAYVFAPLPFKRALSGFAVKDIDCLWSFDKTFLTGMGVDTSDAIESRFIFRASQHIFTTAGLTVVTDLEGLRGKRVGIGVGSNLEAEISEIDAVVVKLADQISKLRMITNNRLDAVIGWAPDLLILARREGIDISSLHMSPEIESTGIAFVCNRSAAAAALIQGVDAVIDGYVRSARFEELLKRYGAEAMLRNIAK